MKTVIDMARQAGFREPNPHDGCMGLAYDYRDGTDTGASLERFAELVRADAIADAIADEREACAKVCEDIYNDPKGNDGYDCYYTRPYLECADAIRARGEASIRGQE